MTKSTIKRLFKWRPVGLLILAGIMLLVTQHRAGAQTEQPPEPERGNISSLPVPPEYVLSGVLPDLPPGYMVVEGDVQVTFAEFEQRFRGATENTFASPQGTYADNLWPDGIVLYEFDANVTAANRTAMEAAMQGWENVAAVDFQQCPSNLCFPILGYVHIQNSVANNSPVGYRLSAQIINITSWGNQIIMAHELGHILGLEHEQSRPDRGFFVQVNLNNVCKAGDASCNGGFCFNSVNARIDCDFNFNIVPNALVYGSYDFDSLMHYSRNAFSRNGSDTITVLAPFTATWQNSIGQRTHFSVLDLNVMGCMYARANWRWLSTIDNGPLWQFGTCRFPYNNLANTYANTPSGGRLWIEPGTYAGIGTYSKATTWTAPNGTVTIGN